MRPIICYIMVTVSCFITCISNTFAKGTNKVHRIAIIINSSASMADNILGDTSKFQLASSFIIQLTDSIYERNPVIELGMRSYGAVYNAKESIRNDSRIEVAFGRDNRSKVALRLLDIKPKGKGDVCYALDQFFKNDYTDTAKYIYSLILVSDSIGQGSNCCSTLAVHFSRLYRTYFIAAPTSYSTTCYGSLLNVANAETLQHSLDSVARDFPLLESTSYNWVTQSNKKTRPTVMELTTASAEAIPAAKSQKIKDTVVIANRQAKTAIQERPSGDGYANIIRGSQLYSLMLYVSEQGVYKWIDELFFYGEPSKKVRLPAGKYKISYTNDTTDAHEFRVVAGMITDVRIK